ncbi:MAG: 50S ribosomal protein L24 [Limisphaerales bacterium]
MPKFHVKRGDEVVVLAGTERGKRGKILRVLTGKQRVVVEGLKLIKKHLRKSQQYPQGTIIQREGTIHLSNVMRAEQYDARTARRQPAPAPASA